MGRQALGGMNLAAENGWARFLKTNPDTRGKVQLPLQVRHERPVVPMRAENGAVGRRIGGQRWMTERKCSISDAPFAFEDLLYIETHRRDVVSQNDIA